MNKKLYRDTSHKILGGVAAGLAEYMNTDISIIRILFIITGFWHHFFGSAAILIYILLWIILPEKRSISQSPQGFMAGPPSSNPNDPNFEANYRVDESSENQQNFSPPQTPVSSNPHYQRNQIGGIILVIIGILFLTEEYVEWDFSFLDRYWPAGLIILGIILIISTNSSKNKTV